MATLSTSSAYMLQPSLQDLHNKTLEWESTIEHWKKELEFFKKLIDRYGAKLNFRHDINEKEHFNFLLTYYAGELMGDLTNRIHQHEARLKPLLKNQSEQDERGYRVEHTTLERDMTIIENEFQCYKNELYTLIEKVIAKIKIKNGTL